MSIAGYVPNVNNFFKIYDAKNYYIDNSDELWTELSFLTIAEKHFSFNILSYFVAVSKVKPENIEFFNHLITFKMFHKDAKNFIIDLIEINDRFMNEDMYVNKSLFKEIENNDKKLRKSLNDICENI